jgi:trans-aconitate 2-methyltransferase
VLYPKIIARVVPGGAFAAQMPADIDSPPHRLMREIAPGMRVKEWHAHPSHFYYDLLTPLCTRVDVWETEYLHVLANAEAIVEWYRGTGLRPFLEALATESDRDRFLEEYLKRIRALYPPRSDGNVLFPFRRLFVVAYRN